MYGSIFKTKYVEMAKYILVAIFDLVSLSTFSGTSIIIPIKATDYLPTYLPTYPTSPICVLHTHAYVRPGVNTVCR